MDDAAWVSNFFGTLISFCLPMERDVMACKRKTHIWQEASESENERRDTPTPSCANDDANFNAPQPTKYDWQNVATFYLLS